MAGPTPAAGRVDRLDKQRFRLAIIALHHPCLCKITQCGGSIDAVARARRVDDGDSLA